MSFRPQPDSGTSGAAAPAKGQRYGIPKVLSRVISYSNLATQPSKNQPLKQSPITFNADYAAILDESDSDENDSQDFNVISPTVQFQMKVSASKQELTELIAFMDDLNNAFQQVEDNINRVAKNNVRLIEYLMAPADSDGSSEPEET